MCIEVDKKTISKIKDEKICTPCFVIHADLIESLADDLFSAMQNHFAGGIVGYSFKTNNLPWIISHVKRKGFWAEVVSSDEYTLAKKLGFSVDHIIFNGPVKGKKEFIEAVEQGAIVNIDSKRELKWLNECTITEIPKCHIGLRVNFCVEDYCPGESQCGSEDGRFGFSYERNELKAAISFLNKIGVPLSGLHLHCSSKTRSINIYKAIAEVAREIVGKYKLKLEYVDIGGGFFGGVAGKPSFAEYLGTIKEVFKAERLLDDIKLIVEPGMSMVGAPVDYIAEVVDVKETKNNSFAVLDGSRIHIDPLMRKQGYTYSIQRKHTDHGHLAQSKEQILCGFTCMEGDRFFRLSSAPLAVGDQVTFERVGGYTMGLSPQFIEAYPAVYVERDGIFELVRRKQDLPEK